MPDMTVDDWQFLDLTVLSMALVVYMLSDFFDRRPKS
jgi:hypothetical protein